MDYKMQDVTGRRLQSEYAGAMGGPDLCRTRIVDCRTAVDGGPRATGPELGPHWMIASPFGPVCAVAGGALFDDDETRFQEINNDGGQRYVSPSPLRGGRGAAGHLAGCPGQGAA